MSDFIGLGDAIDHRGKVATAWEAADYDGIQLTRKGDQNLEENMNDIVDRRNNFASIHNWGGLK